MVTIINHSYHHYGFWNIFSDQAMGRSEDQHFAQGLGRGPAGTLAEQLQAVGGLKG